MTKRNEKPVVLLVDDNPQNLQVLGNLLQCEDYEIAAATRGEQAIAIAREIKPALILLDIMMPGKDGFETCKILKSDQALKEIPIIFLTAKSQPEEKVKGFELGAVDYITKPFQSKELMARVRTHLELRAARNELLNAVRTKNKFFSIIAHDLRSPFSTITSFIRLIKKNIDTLSKADILRYVDELNNTNQKALFLLDNLLWWSRSQTGRIALSPISINLSTMARETVELLKESAENKQISIDIQIDTDLLIFADKNMTSTIFRNLIGNSIKFTNPRGNITISVKKKQELAEISITDTGVGMDQYQLASLFVITENISRNGTRNEKGSGLGLILCKEFIEKNGGRIWADSKKEKGSTFTFTLPIAK